jgi:AcrR family transcriptional regulator
MPTDKTKDKILKVSRELFMKKGYDSTSMSDISSKVGINKASLYYFFEDKEHLYFEIMRKALDNILSYLEDVEKVKKYNFVEIIEKLIIISSKDSIIAYILDTDSINKSSKGLSEIHRGISDVQDLFRKICKDAGVGQPQVAAEVTLNAIHAYTIKSSCHNMSVKPRDYAKYLSQLLEKNK